ncbi:MAG: glycosyltransferase [Bacillus sp. (in: Bacteria)]|nr:glycosyltransferase [Bacillus sp. (in: firmicutes)]MCM1426012.1 glycosyltransferase [Eubacterium sp.]
MNPKVNVIVPVYNVAPYLNRFFDSLLEQTFQDFDVWIVNDKSIDNSLEIIEEYAKRYPAKLNIINNTINLGLSGARNVGLERCDSNGEYILLLDSDDYIESTYIEKMVSNAEKYHADITICGLERFDDDTGKCICKEMINNPEELITDIKNFEMLGYMNPVVWNKLFRRTVIEDMKFTEIKRSEDTVFLFSILPRVKSIKFVNEVLYHYRVRNASLSGAITNEIYESMLDGFNETRKYFVQNKEYAEFMDLFVVQMFIRCGVGGACRLSFKDMRRALYYAKNTKKYMDEYFPEWRENKYLSLQGWWKRDLHAVLLSCAAVLYKWHLFVFFIYLYWFMSCVCKKDFRA